MKKQLTPKELQKRSEFLNDYFRIPRKKKLHRIFNKFIYFLWGNDQFELLEPAKVSPYYSYSDDPEDMKLIIDYIRKQSDSEDFFFDKTPINLIP